MDNEELSVLSARLNSLGSDQDAVLSAGDIEKLKECLTVITQLSTLQEAITQAAQRGMSIIENGTGDRFIITKAAPKKPTAADKSSEKPKDLSSHRQKGKKK